MASKQVLFHKNNNYMLIGEDHVGGFDFDFNDPVHVKYLLKLILKDKNRGLHLWYEGPNRSAISKSFVAFKGQLERFFQNEGLGVVFFRESGWEVGLTFDRLDEITNFTIGNSENYYHEKLPKNENTLLDAMVASTFQGNFRGTLSTPPTKNEFILALSEGTRPSDILEVLMQEDSNIGSNRTQNIKRLFNDSYTSMRAKYYKGTPGAYSSSQIYKRIDNINIKRDNQLAKVMKTEGGIFLAGSGHVDNIKKMGIA